MNALRSPLPWGFPVPVASLPVGCFGKQIAQWTLQAEVFLELTYSEILKGEVLQTLSEIRICHDDLKGLEKQWVAVRWAYYFWYYCVTQGDRSCVTDENTNSDEICFLVRVTLPSWKCTSNSVRYRQSRDDRKYRLEMKVLHSIAQEERDQVFMSGRQEHYCISDQSYQSMLCCFTHRGAQPVDEQVVTLEMLWMWKPENT